MPTFAADMPPAIVQCRVSKPDDAKEYWQWRQIDGRTCWYPGRAIKPKHELRWPSQSSPQRPAEGGEGLAKPAQGEPPPAPMLIQGSFEDRWLGLEGCSSDGRVWDCRQRQR